MACTTGIAGRNALAWSKLRASFFNLLMPAVTCGRKMDKGHPLDETTRAEMEAALGYELKDVRVHRTKQAGELARRLEAEAFTIGADIFAAEEKLDTHSKQGKGLLAHELTHVVQQIRPNSIRPDPCATGQQSWQDNTGQVSPAITMERSDLGLVPVPQFALPSSFPIGSSELTRLESEARIAEQVVQDIKDAAMNEQAVIIDAADIADRVYQLMQLELLLENDRVRR